MTTNAMTYADKISMLQAVEGTCAAVTVRYPKKVSGRYQTVTETVTGFVKIIGTKGGLAIGNTVTLIAYVEGVNAA